MPKRYLSLLFISLSFNLLSFNLFAQPKPEISIPAENHSAPFVKVFKYDNSTQCAKDGIALEEMQLELENLGIEVSCAQKGDDGMMRPMVCGASTGKLNVYRISADKISDAVTAGFKPVSELKGFQDKPCR